MEYVVLNFSQLRKKWLLATAVIHHRHLLYIINGDVSFCSGSPAPRSKAKMSFIEHGAWTFDAWESS